MAASIDDAIGEIAGKTGLDSAMVQNAIGIITNFIRREAPPATSDALFGKLPGAGALADAHATASTGLFGVFNDLVASGLTLANIPAVTLGFVEYAKAHGGEREVDDVIAAIPGLAQFV